MLKIFLCVLRGLGFSKFPAKYFQNMQNIRVIFKIILIVITIKINHIKLALTLIKNTKLCIILKIRKTVKNQ